MTAEITIIVPLVVGLIIGLLEAYFVYEDENMTSGKDFIKDMWHGLIFCVVGVLAASNVPFLMTLIPESFHGFLMVNEATGASIVVSILIAVIMYVKMVASHAVKGIGGRGFKEKAWHKLVIALLVGFAPFYIVYLRGPLEVVTAFFPDWVPF